MPLAALLAAAEGLGRLRPEAHPREGGADDLARLYEPGATLVVEPSPGTRATARPELHDQRWAMPAPGYRVAVVGDSTVWGQLPDALEQGLGGEARTGAGSSAAGTSTTTGGALRGAPPPPQEIEVLNFGIRGAASDRARIAADAALAQDLDLLVVYVGHNEVTEARLNPFSLRPFWQRRLSAAVLRSGTARLLGPLLAPLRERLGPTSPTGTNPAALRANGDAAARPLTPEEWAPVAAAYRANLAATCEAAHEADVPVLLVAPVSSLVNPGEAPDGAPAALRDALMAGIGAARLGDPAEALAWADRLRRDFPTYGPPHALRGVALLGLGRGDEALAELKEARRKDAQPVRATEDHHAIVREVATGCGATAVATEPIFLADPRYLALEDALFVDRVHPTLAGNVLLAGAIAAAAPLPDGVTFDPARVTLETPADEAARGWKVLDQLWGSGP